jgi:hypothetical protein
LKSVESGFDGIERTQAPTEGNPDTSTYDGGKFHAPTLTMNATQLVDHNDETSYSLVRELKTEIHR